MKAFEDKAKEADLMVWTTEGPRMTTVGTMLFSTDTVFAPWLHAFKKLHNLTVIVYENPFLSSWRGIPVGGLNTYRRFKKFSMSVVLGAELWIEKITPCQGLPPSPEDGDKSSTNESHEPSRQHKIEK